MAGFVTTTAALTVVTCAVTVTEPVAPAASDGMLQPTVPLAPTPGLVQPPVQLANRKPAGSGSLIVTLVAVALPVFA